MIAMEHQTTMTKQPHLSALAQAGIVIGVQKQAHIRSGATFPFAEIELRRETIPTDDAMLKIAKQLPRETTWHIAFDEFHCNTFDRVDWLTFTNALANDDKRRNMLIVAFERDVEYASKLLDAIETMRDNLTIPILLDAEHLSWKSTSVQNLLKALKCPQVLADAPDLPGLVKDAAFDIGRVAYLRLRGRNARHWFDRDANSKYEYQYDMEELRSIAERVKSLRDRHEEVIVTLCNRPPEAAMKNALELARLLA